MKTPLYAVFFDFHTMKSCPDVGHEFQAESFAEGLQSAGVNWVGFHAKCNQGFCYYDTRIGHRHPSLPPDCDLFGSVVESCHGHGMGVSAYFNCGLSNEDGVCHPDWCRISPEGHVLHPEIYEFGWVSPYIRTMCPNSPYRDYLLSLIGEVQSRYPVNGFLFDSFNVFPCVCPHCVAGMRALGLDPSCAEDVLRFAKRSVLRLAADISRLIRPREHGLMVYFLGLSPRENMRLGSYLECECLPTNPAWGYDLLPMTSRHFRTLCDGPVFNMTGRFNTWGDFGSLRPAVAVEYDLFFGLANGMNPNIGDHLHPRGRMAPGVLERITGIYRKIHAYDAWYEGASNLVDLAVVFRGRLEKTPALVGFTRMLSELKIQFDLIDLEQDWSPYSLVVLPDDLVVDERLEERLRRHFACGGKVLATGTSGLNAEGTAFVCEEEWGVRRVGDCPHSPAYFRMRGVAAEAFPDLPLATYTTGVETVALKGTEVAGTVVAPYYNHHWDGVYSHFYAPPAKDTDTPFVTLNDRVAYCAFPLGKSYYLHASPDVRQVLAVMLGRLLPRPLLVEVSGLSSVSRVFVTEQGTRRRMVHILNYLPEKRGDSLVVEDELPLYDVTLKLRLDGGTCGAVTAAPSGERLAFETDDGYVSFTLPRMRGYGLVAVDLEH